MKEYNIIVDLQSITLTIKGENEQEILDKLSQEVYDKINEID